MSKNEQVKIAKTALVAGCRQLFDAAVLMATVWLFVVVMFSLGVYNL